MWALVYLRREFGSVLACVNENRIVTERYAYAPFSAVQI